MIDWDEVERTTDWEALRAREAIQTCLDGCLCTLVDDEPVISKTTGLPEYNSGTCKSINLEGAGDGSDM